MTIEINQVQYTVEVTEQVVGGTETNVVEIRYQGLQQTLLQALQVQVDTLEDTVDAGFAGVNGDIGPLITQINAVEANVTALDADLTAEEAARIAADNALTASMVLIAPPLQAEIDAEEIARAAADAAEVVARNAAITAATGPIIADVDALELATAGYSADISALEASQTALQGTVTALDADFTILDASVVVLSADVTDAVQAVIDETTARGIAEAAIYAAIAASSNRYFPGGWS